MGKIAINLETQKRNALRSLPVIVLVMFGNFVNYWTRPGSSSNFGKISKHHSYTINCCRRQPPILDDVL
jgi:hypothetical protein